MIGLIRLLEPLERRDYARGTGLCKTPQKMDNKHKAPRPAFRLDQRRRAPITSFPPSGTAGFPWSGAAGQRDAAACTHVIGGDHAMRACAAVAGGRKDRRGVIIR